ncbi:hypothetical protein SBADM41S_08101 [Streptomyces badius]
MKPYTTALVEDGIPAAAFAVDDVRAEFDRLSKLGVRFTQEPTETGPSPPPSWTTPAATSSTVMHNGG